MEKSRDAGGSLLKKKIEQSDKQILTANSKAAISVVLSVTKIESIAQNREGGPQK